MPCHEGHWEPPRLTLSLMPAAPGRCHRHGTGLLPVEETLVRRTPQGSHNCVHSSHAMVVSTPTRYPVLTWTPDPTHPISSPPLRVDGRSRCVSVRHRGQHGEHSLHAQRLMAPAELWLCVLGEYSPVYPFHSVLPFAASWVWCEHLITGVCAYFPWCWHIWYGYTST